MAHSTGAAMDDINIDHMTVKDINGVYITSGVDGPSKAVSSLNDFQSTSHGSNSLHSIKVKDIKPAGDQVVWPHKTRQFQNHLMDSRRWDHLAWREGDVVIATWAKCGTTWVQQIVGQLIFEGDPDINSSSLSPWVEMRIVPTEVTSKLLAAQKHRRFMKTHLPLDALVYKPSARYIFVARDARDMVWSMHHHLRHCTDAFYEAVNGNGLVGQPLIKPGPEPRGLFLDLIEDDSRTSMCWPVWSHIRAYWKARHLPNMLLVHFNELKADLERQIRRIATFLDIEVSEDKMPNIVKHCTFGWMKANAQKVCPPMINSIIEGGPATFINKGTNGQWRDVLTDEDNQRFHQKAREELGEGCAHWLETGNMELFL